MAEVKGKGGLGFRELQDFNQALLAKQLRRILTKPNLLMSKVMKARYFSGAPLWTMEKKPNDSWMWQSILQSRELLKEGLRMRIGDGNTVHMWKDKWLLRKGSGLVRPRSDNGENVEKVSEVIVDGKWNKELLEKVCNEADVKEILKIPLSLEVGKHRLYWCHSSTGVYTVKSGYMVARGQKKEKKRRKVIVVEMKSTQEYGQCCGAEH